MNTVRETFTNQWFSASFIWRAGLLVRIDLTGECLTGTAPQSDFGTTLRDIIENFGNLEKDVWPDLPLDNGTLPAFTCRVLETLRASAPRGSWTTYGELAALCGSAGGARAVGNVMAGNRWPLYYPCHRVLANSGLGGFGPGLELKRTLLTLEKVPLPD